MILGSYLRCGRNRPRATGHLGARRSLGAGIGARACNRRRKGICGSSRIGRCIEWRKGGGALAGG